MILIIFSVDGGIPPKNGRYTASHDVMCIVNFSGYTSIKRKIIIVNSYHLILNVINMSLNEFDVHVANGVANDVLPVW